MKTTFTIHDWPLLYQDQLDQRSTEAIDLIVIHCTELPDLVTAREYAERILYPASKTGNSGHYYIERDGCTHRFVDDQCIAHHVHGYNPRSIGIELVNRGRYPDWLDSRHQQFTEPYPKSQVDALLQLLHYLIDRYPHLRYIAGHEELDQRQEPASDIPAVQVPRRRDPGPLFPWDRLSIFKLQRLTAVCYSSLIVD